MKVENSNNFQVKRVWKNKNMRKVFLDVITNTQLHKCKQIKRLIMRLVGDMISDHDLCDDEIYSKLHKFIHQDLKEELREKIQHKEEYRAVNRANKIVNLITQYGGNHFKPKSVLDIGCDDGCITSNVGKILGLDHTNIHGCDVISESSQNITYFKHTQETIDSGLLPYSDCQHDVIYAFMSIHHIKNAEKTIAEMYRVLKPGGLLLIREHDCDDDEFSAVLDIIHGFYSMVWSNPTELHCFKNDYWAKYWSAKNLTSFITSNGFSELLNTNKSSANFPVYAKGRVINPLKYYYAVYRKN